MERENVYEMGFEWFYEVLCGFRMGFLSFVLVSNGF